MVFHEEDCPKCNGRKIIPIKFNLSLHDICPVCKGAGKRDWIEKAMGRFPRAEIQNLKRDIISRNVQNLIREAQIQAAELGMSLDIEYKMNNSGHDYFNRMYMPKWEDI